MALIIDPQSNKVVTRWDEFVKRKAFYIHGTKSTPERWNLWQEAVHVLNKIALVNDGEEDTAFDWSDRAGQLNNLKDRWAAAERLVEYVKSKASNFQEIVLIGHSHGGNVAIIAADKLAAESIFSDIYVVTVGTPVFNKETFDSNNFIDVLEQKKEKQGERVVIKERYEYNYMTHTLYKVRKYSYLNPENPINWKHPNKITHLSLYNEYDRVDGIAEIGDGIIERSRMTTNTSSFVYNEDINVHLFSQVEISISERHKYLNHCSHRISMLSLLRDIVWKAEIPCEIVGMRLESSQILYDIVCPGYREITTLPAFKEFNRSIYVSEGMPEIDVEKIKHMQLADMHIFFDEALFSDFIVKFNSDLKSPLRSDFSKRLDDKLRTTNIIRIEAEIAWLENEVKTLGAYNQRTVEDKSLPGWFNKMYNFLDENVSDYNIEARGHILFLKAIKYLTDGIDNHSFDTNSPELIQQAIDDGRITPFARNIKVDDETIEK